MPPIRTRRPEAPAPVTTTPGILPEDASLVELLGHTRTESGKSLLAMLDERPIMLVFLRHFGCPTTRETLDNVAAALPDLERRGVRPVFVHMAAPERARPFFDKYRLSDAERISDPARELYTAPVFNLLRSTGVPEFFTPQTRWAVAKRTLLRYGPGGAAGKGEDPTQLPGVFFLKDRAIYRAFRHKSFGDRPDYARFGA